MAMKSSKRLRIIEKKQFKNKQAEKKEENNFYTAEFLYGVFIRVNSNSVRVRSNRFLINYFKIQSVQRRTHLDRALADLFWR